MPRFAVVDDRGVTIGETEFDDDADLIYYDLNGVPMGTGKAGLLALRESSMRFTSERELAAAHDLTFSWGSGIWFDTDEVRVDAELMEDGSVTLTGYRFDDPGPETVVPGVAQAFLRERIVELAAKLEGGLV